MFEFLSVPPLALRLSWTEGGSLERISLAWSIPQEEDRLETSVGEALKQCLGEYVRSGTVAWPELPLAWEILPRFSRDVLRRLKDQVGPGQWLTYSELAKRCGSPGGARAVGGAMRRNPWPLVVPCHRVLAKGKALGGFSGGLDLKRYLLELEGISPAGC